jgi:polar amino acid transport system substrate-binding protein
MSLRLLMSAAAIAMTVMSAPGSARDVHVGVPPDSMPLVGIDNGHLTGVIGDITQVVLERMGHSVTVEPMPFARLYKEVDSGNIDAAARVMASDERRLVTFYSDPILTEYQAIVVPKGKGFPAQTVSDLKGKSFGIQRGFIYPTLDNKPDITLEPGDSIANNVRKMLSGRLDGVIVNSVFGVAQLREANLLDQVDILPDAAAPVPLCVALAHARFSDAERQQFNQILAQVLATPDAERIRSQYGDPTLFKKYVLMHE